MKNGAVRESQPGLSVEVRSATCRNNYRVANWKFSGLEFVLRNGGLAEKATVTVEDRIVVIKVDVAGDLRLVVADTEEDVSGKSPASLSSVLPYSTSTSAPRYS